MDFPESLRDAMAKVNSAKTGSNTYMDRIATELEFAHQFSELFPDKKAEWQGLILKAAQTLNDRLSGGGPVDIAAVVKEAEATMSPIGQAAKEHTVHCCGHAHIDMNWLWPWQETVNVSIDTFSTVDRLMDEFPGLKFSQSQTSTYAGVEEYAPEIFEMIGRRIAEGRWEPTASMWVEGSKNLASGEILCRHMLYTRRYFNEKFGLPYDAIKIDWEPDTFGHAHTIPTILEKGGISRYYHCRTGPNNWLTWWQGPDGSRVLLLYDKTWYNGVFEPVSITKGFIDYTRETGLKDFLHMFGLGDHGGGPTRKDLTKALEMQQWPIFPSLLFSTTDAYYSAVEKQDLSRVPVHDGELNFVFEGCYTSQSNIKYANRVSEIILPEIESIALIAGATAGFPYPMEHIRKGWRMAMFNQFHDILPGSGIHATYEYSQGLFQEIQSIAYSVRARALRKMASRIDTSAASGIEPPTGTAGQTIGNGIGAGAGDPSLPGGMTSRNAGAVSAEPVVVFNQMPFPRTEIVQAKVWNKQLPHNKIAVRDEHGSVTAGQVIETGAYWGHDYTTVAFPAADVPGMGYRTYTVDETVKTMTVMPTEGALATQGAGSFVPQVDFQPEEQASQPAPGILENKYLRVEVDGASGAIKHLIDKETGYDYVPEGELMGVLEFCTEAPHGMTSWEIGQIRTLERLAEGGFIVDRGMGYDIPPDGGLYIWDASSFWKNGPHRASVKTARKVGDSRIFVEIGLNADSRMVDFNLSIDWREIGTRTRGIPMLRIAFPTRVADTKATYEIPFGSIQRETNGREVPALRWADLSGNRMGAEGEAGITMVNDSKYGHNADGNTLRLTLLRSSIDPDPVPEVNHHDIRLAIVPHEGLCDVSEAMRAGASFNLPMNVVSTDIHKGDLAPSKGFVEVLDSNVMAASVKKAEDSDAVIIRLYEVEGKGTEARVKLSEIVKPGAPAVEVDLMEQPLQKSTARMEGDTLVVTLPALSLVTVKIG